MSTIRKYAIWALCIYFVTGLSAGVHGSVLCVAPDESAKVEAVCQTSCGDTETSCDAKQPGVESEVHPHCVGCTDIPLIYDSLLRRDLVSHLIDDSSPLHLAQATHVGVCNLAVIRTTSPPTQGPKVTHLNSISTTILIC